MTNGPERIWIEDEFGEGDDDQWTYGTWDVRNYRGYVVEYVRADIVQELTAERDEAINQLDSATHSVEVLEKRVAEFMAECDQLRAALEDIADHDTGATAGLAYTAKIALKGETP